MEGEGRESRVKLSRNRSQFPTSSILLFLPLPPSKLPIRETALGLGLGFVIFFYQMSPKGLGFVIELEKKTPTNEVFQKC